MTRLEVEFGQDLDQSYSGWVTVGPATSPTIVGEGFSDARTAYLDVTLEPGTTYAVWIDGFRDALEFPAAKWLLTFRTAEP